MALTDREITIDLRGFERGLIAWARGTRTTLPEAVRKQTILFLRHVLRLLPPKSLAQGRKRIARDLRKAALPIFHQTDSEAIAELVATRDFEGLNAMARRSTAMTDITFVPFDERLHTGARDSRGRVRESQKKAIIDYAAWLAYFRKVSTHVGIAKGSLAGTLVRLGQHVPSWIARHAGHGATVDRTSDRTRPRIRIIARASHLTDLQIDRIIGSTTRARERAMATDLRRFILAEAHSSGFRSG